MMYNLSKDYNLLYEKLCEGHKVVCFVAYRFRNESIDILPSIDICLAKRRKEYDITFSVRGIEYGHVSDYFKDKETELQTLLGECKRMNLEWITH